MITIKASVDTSQISKDLQQLIKKQLPFATAKALTATAQKIQAAERKAMPSVFDRPKPFTVNAISITPANKQNLTATVYIKPIAEAYLEPYEFGGNNKLNSKALLKPITQTLDQFGNIPRTSLSRYKNRKDIYIGKIKTRKGFISGVWHKPSKELKKGGFRKGANSTGRLKLLIRFTDAHPAKQHINWFTTAGKIFEQNAVAELNKAIAEALRTSR